MCGGGGTDENRKGGRVEGGRVEDSKFFVGSDERIDRNRNEYTVLEGDKAREARLIWFGQGVSGEGC